MHGKRGKPDDGLRSIFHNHLPRIHWQAMELGVVGAGVPDSNFCWSGVDGWIEYKATADYSVGLEPEQVGWISRRMRAGGRVFIATRRRHDGGPRLGDPVDELWIHEGWDAATLKASGLSSCPPVLYEENGPSSWNWSLIESVLVEWVIGRRE